MLLNLRSRETNLHPAMNSLLLWDGRVPKRVVQTLNHYAFCTSYHWQTKAVGSVSKDAVCLAQCVANDPPKMSLLPYDNFNWVSKAWETSATHGNVSHDQVSALLLVLNLPPGSGPTDATRLSHVLTFEQSSGPRHVLPPEVSLEQILPSSRDQRVFAKHAIIHVSQILAEEMKIFSAYHNVFSSFVDPHAIPAMKSEEYFLPTYDQEQSSTQGNMLVIEHYFKDVLKIPVEVFQDINFFLLGDRLTTARDRAAQDQQALDRSEYRLDHLASSAALSGLMHFVLNQTLNLGKNTWGTSAKDAVSLSTLLEKLPNKGNINLRKIDFYAWLSLEQFYAHKISADGFKSLCTQIVNQGCKKLPGSTVSGNAVLLMHDLMTMREMRHAIKHGHPERVERMLKYRTPIFYAGGSFNYANESMELLHNLIHDWPPETAEILRAGMLMNNQGKSNTFKEADIRVEQFNKSIKSHAQGANAQPGLLEKITPAIGHIQKLTEKLFHELGVFDEDQHHTDVSQHKDVTLLLEHFHKYNIFDFSRDTVSNHLVVDLFRTGLHRLAGPDGHARHLRRHVLRSRHRHHNELPPGYLENMTTISKASDPSGNGNRV
ncbi:hypothetical protein B0H19DRAFT_1208163 [Mycena capillaripes]|nr:hypothetical protein B0H19DRAFT_1208163 [Mycena capillaripes]